MEKKKSWIFDSEKEKEKKKKGENENFGYIFVVESLKKVVILIFFRFSRFWHFWNFTFSDHEKINVEENNLRIFTTTYELYFEHMKYDF